MFRHDCPACLANRHAGRLQIGSEKYTEVVGEQRALVEQDFAGDDLELLARLLFHKAR